MNLYVIDFETFYAKGYTLTGMSTEEYIRHDNFEAIMVSIKKNDEPAQVFTGEAMTIRLDAMREELESSAILCHHAHFDGLILSHHFGIKPRMWFDTLSMARALHGTQVGGSLAKLVKYYGIGEKGTEVVNAMGKRLKDFSAEDLKKYEEYCALDTDLTYALFKKMFVHFTKSELHTIDIFIRMFTEPELRIDCDLADKWVEEIKANKARLVLECGVSKDELMSNDRFAAALANVLAEHNTPVPMKISPATGKLTYAFAKTDEEFSALLEHPDERVQALVSARLGNKTTINETRGAKFSKMGARGAAPVYIKYAGAAQTLRSSGGDGMNWQNLGKTKSPKARNVGQLVMTPAGWGELDAVDPIEGTRHVNYHTDQGMFNSEVSDVHLVGLRDVVHADVGKVLVVADSSNIEARVLAMLADQKDAIDRFRNKIDPYCHMASHIYGRPVTKADTAERFLGKVAVLGLGYGMGAQKFQDTAKAWGAGDIDILMAKATVDAYRMTYDKVPQLWKRFENALPFIAGSGEGKLDIDSHGVLQAEAGRIILPSGLGVRYPDLKRTTEGWVFWGGLMKGTGDAKEKLFTKVYGGLATENAVQALARIIVTDQMNKIALRYPVKWFIHDEVVLHVPEAEADEALAYALEVMATSPTWWPGIPLAAEGDFHYTYGMAK